MKRFIAILSLSVLISACQVIRPEGPSCVTSEFPQDTLVSKINLPVTLDIKQFEPLIKPHLSNGTVLYHGRNISAGPGKLEVRVSVISDPILGTRNGKLFLQFRSNIYLYYVIRRCVFGVCGSKTWKKNVQTTLTTEIRPAFDENWNFKPDVSGGFSNTTPIRFNVFGFTITFASEVRNALNDQWNSTLKPKIEEILTGTVNIRDEVERAWPKLTTNIRLAADPTEIWMQTSPDKINFAPAISDDNLNLLFLNLSLEGRLRTVIGEQPSLLPGTPLPPLGNQPNNDKSFDIKLPLILEYDGINEVLESELTGEEYDLEGYKVTVRGLKVTGCNDKMLIELKFKAKKPKGLFKRVRGRLYFSANPKWDGEEDVLSVEEVDFSAETNRLLLNKAVWLINQILTNKIEEKLKYDATDDLKGLVGKVNSSLDSIPIDPFFVKGKVDKLSLDKIYPTTEFINLNFGAKGEIEIGTQSTTTELQN